MTLALPFARIFSIRDFRARTGVDASQCLDRAGHRYGLYAGDVRKLFAFDGKSRA